ncbi:hypothetical protein FF38_13063 [Lucilia cuprina]|uniref:Uncharacterized protein n=1 Tax=Lucilia cuprina TaxID=7375 RepID=A0A0L0C1F8_LUCCU|nr:hypothetical protein FF38_13063 [Lucilia cuprina]
MKLLVFSYTIIASINSTTTPVIGQTYNYYSNTLHGPFSTFLKFCLIRFDNIHSENRQIRYRTEECPWDLALMLNVHVGLGSIGIYAAVVKTQTIDADFMDSYMGQPVRSLDLVIYSTEANTYATEQQWSYLRVRSTWLLQIPHPMSANKTKNNR